MKRFILIGVLISGSMFAGQKDTFDWQTFNSSQKVAYLMGIADMASITPRVAFHFNRKNITAGEVMSAMDAIYDNPANCKITTLFMYSIVVLQFNGASEYTIQKEIEYARNAFSK